MVNPLKNNALHLHADLEWLADVITKRYYAHHENKKLDVQKLDAPSHYKEESIYKKVIKKFKFSNAERIVVLLALIPHIAPYFIDDIIAGIQ